MTKMLIHNLTAYRIEYRETTESRELFAKVAGSHTWHSLGSVRARSVRGVVSAKSFCPWRITAGDAEGFAFAVGEHPAPAHERELMIISQGAWVNYLAEVRRGWRSPIGELVMGGRGEVRFTGVRHPNASVRVELSVFFPEGDLPFLLNARVK